MKRRLQRLIAFLRRDDGSNLVEAAISSIVLFAMLFGTCQMATGLYIYNYVSDAARQASRYAMVRGSTSCTNTPSLSNCGVTSDQVQTWVRALHYPAIRTAHVSAVAVWCAASVTSGSTSWPSCSGGTLAKPGNMVKVTVGYPLSFTIPMSAWTNGGTSKQVSVTISATSAMTIAQ